MYISFTFPDNRALEGVPLEDGPRRFPNGSNRSRRACAFPATVFLDV